MKLWHLTANPDLVTWDCASGFVVRANTEEEARQLAASQPGFEGKETWLNPQYSTCKRLTTRGEAGIIIRDFQAG